MVDNESAHEYPEQYHSIYLSKINSFPIFLKASYGQIPFNKQEPGFYLSRDLSDERILHVLAVYDSEKYEHAIISANNFAGRWPERNKHVTIEGDDSLYRSIERGLSDLDYYKKSLQGYVQLL